MRVVSKFNNAIVCKELMEKAQNISNLDDFDRLSNEYGLEATITAFRNTHEHFNDDYYIEESLENYFYDELIGDVVERTLSI